MGNDRKSIIPSLQALSINQKRNIKIMTKNPTILPLPALIPILKNC